MISALIGRYKFLRKNITKVFSTASPSFRAQYLNDYLQIMPRLGPFKTRHLELSRNIKIEENEVRKGLQTAARRLYQKTRKRQNSLMK